MIVNRLWRRLLCSVGTLLLIVGVCVLSIDAKAWVDASQHQLGKRYKATETSEHRLKSPAAAIGLNPVPVEPPPLVAEILPPALQELPRRSRWFSTSHALRAPPVPIRYEIVL